MGAATVPAALRHHVCNSILRIEKVEGHKDLDADSQAALESVLSRAAGKLRDPAMPLGASVDVKQEDCDAEPASVKVGPKVADSKKQPKPGAKSGAKGAVEWKWGSMLCSGILLPSKETSTHCYAKTHKGNVKTLAKGKAYWWVAA